MEPGGWGCSSVVPTCLAQVRSLAPFLAWKGRKGGRKGRREVKREVRREVGREGGMEGEKEVGKGRKGDRQATSVSLSKFFLEQSLAISISATDVFAYSRRSGWQ